MLKYIICCDVCGTEQTSDTIIQSKYGQHLCFCPACARYLKAAQYRNQQVTALLPMPDDPFEIVTREQYIKNYLFEKSRKRESDQL